MMLAGIGCCCMLFVSKIKDQTHYLQSNYVYWYGNVTFKLYFEMYTVDYLLFKEYTLDLKLLLFSFTTTSPYSLCNLNCVSSIAGKLIEIEQQSSLHTTMRPGWEDLVRRCMQMFLNRSEGQPWSYKRHYQDGM